jgi:hypothetical protein
MKTFTCKLDKVSILITFNVLLFGLFLLIGPNLSFVENREGSIILQSAGALLLLMTIVFYLLSPRAYGFDKEYLFIGRMIAPLRIPLSEITNVRMPDTKELSWAIRTFGNGGLFGYTGRYYTKHIGKMNWQCTRRSNFVVIERINKVPLIISPEEPAKFVFEFNQGIR